VTGPNAPSLRSGRRSCSAGGTVLRRSCTINYQFTPTAAGTRTATFTLTDSTPTPADTFTDAFTSVARRNRRTLSSHPAIPDTLVNTTSAASTVTVSNTGTGNLNVTGRNQRTNASDFAITVTLVAHRHLRSRVRSRTCRSSLHHYPDAYAGAHGRGQEALTSLECHHQPEPCLLAGNGIWPAASYVPTVPGPLASERVHRP